MPTGNYDISNPRLVGPLSLSTASLTGFASAVTGASWALTATTVPDGAAHRVTIQNNSANNKSGINITVVGTDANGNALSETLAGPTGSATVTTAGYFKTLTSVTPASTWGADTANIGYAAQIQTAFLNINILAEDALAVNVDISGTISYTVEQTFDDLNAASPVWQTLVGAGSQTADGIWNTTGGATGLRVTVASYSAGATMRVNANPTAMINAPGAGGGGGGGGSDVDLVAVGGTAITLGQAVMASSFPVVLASNQTWTGALNLGKAEDAVHASGDVGIMALGVATDGSTALSAAGDYSVMGTDTAGNMRVVGSVASATTDSGNPIKVGGVYNTTLPIFTNAQRGDLQVGTRGSLAIQIMAPNSTAGLADNNGVYVQGGTASGATDVGAPVKIGALYSTAFGAVSTGQRTNLLADRYGNLRTMLVGTSVTGTDGSSNTNLISGLPDSADSAGAFRPITVAPSVFNGTSWDRQRLPSSTSRIVSSAATTNATSGKASAGWMFAITGYNSNAAVRYLKLYNKASAPTVGSDTPIMTIALVPSAGFAIDFPAPYYFSTGIAYALTTGSADADTGAVGAGDILGLNIAYS